MKQQNSRPQTFQRIVPLKEEKVSEEIDIIQQTRKRVKGLDQMQRFTIAQIHLLNALHQRSPRLDTYSPNLSKKFRFCYYLQTSNEWKFFLLFISYVFMYLIIWGNKPTPIVMIFVQILILIFGWADVVMEIYHKKFEVLKVSSRFQLRFYIRTVILLLLVVDQIIVIIAPQWKIRPLVLFRCLLPLFYDTNVRKAFEALLSSYKDILVFLVFYSFVIICFAIITHQIVQLPKNAGEDQYQSDYNDLGKTIFIMYVLATYDAYPDNQMVAIRTSLWIYAFFICFIILNAFFFVNIPVALIFNSFRQTRSKIVIIDQIKSQHSLIMSFVSLGEQNLTVTQTKLIRFLLYLYKNKVRYVDQITIICRKLDQNCNGIIHVNQFMQLCRIIKSDKDMFPPKFYDWNRWVLFRRNINSIFKVRKLVLSKSFKICSCVIIVVTFINALISLYTTHIIFDFLDDIFIMFFICQIIIKFMGLGYEQFFRDPWNKLDIFIILLGFIFQLLPFNVGPHNADLLFKMARIFRIGSLAKFLNGKSKTNNEIYEKSARLIKQTAIIIPTILRFFPFFLVTFYVISVAAMSIFQQDNVINTGQSPYADYDQFSNFKTFVTSHVLLVQLMVESNWSMIAYHHVFKFGNYGLTMIFFVLVHMTIVTIISSLLKGVIWQVYNALNDQFYERKANRIKILDHERQMEKKRSEIEEVKVKFNLKQILTPDNIVVKKLYENKIDLQILNELRQTYEKKTQMFASKKKIKISQIFNNIFQEYTQDNQKQKQAQLAHQNNHQLNHTTNHQVNHQFNDQANRTITHQISKKKTINRLKTLGNIEDIEDLQKQDIEDQMDRMLSQIILTHKFKYSAKIAHPKALEEFITSKLMPINEFMQRKKYNKTKKSLIKDNRKQVKLFTHGLNSLLNIQISQREQKIMIIQSMVKKGMINQEESQKILKRKTTSDEDFDSNWMMRKAFLAQSNQKLINQFQIQYFQDVYGRSFKQINKVTIQPLLKLQSKITYCFRNALRYRQINQKQFFILLTTIENKASSQLLKKGSLFKFVFQVQSIQYWFTIQHLQSHQIKVHFIKNGIWIQNKYMKQNQVYVAEDIFKWENIQKRNDRITCQRYIKMLYQSFESLAFCNKNQGNFFQSNPINYVFDLFSFYRQVHDVKRFTNRKLSISKIMLVILSKQDDRSVPLEYSLSDIKFDQQKQRLKKSLNFKFDQTESETYKKLKRMQLMNYQKLIQNEGIPFQYIVNFINQIQEIISVHQQNLIYHVEELFNDIFEEEEIVIIDDGNKSDSEEIVKIQ